MILGMSISVLAAFYDLSIRYIHNLFWQLCCFLATASVLSFF